MSVMDINPVNIYSSSQKVSSKEKDPDDPLRELKRSIAGKFKGLVPRQWGENIDGVKNHFSTSQKEIVLTFDACDAGFDKKLIDFLIANNIPATLFLSGDFIRKNPEIAKALCGNKLFEIENHGDHHKPCSVNGKSVYRLKGTVNTDAIVDEVELNARAISKLTGSKPLYYRSGGNYYDDVAVKIIGAMGYQAVGYSVLGDSGATFSRKHVKEALVSSQPGSIVIMHMNRPKGYTAEGVMDAIPEMIKNGCKFIKLSDRSLK